MIASGFVSGQPGSSAPKYTVPAIEHLPTTTLVMDSVLISQFIESTYPSPPVPLTSELGREIQSRARAVVGKVFGTSIMPREMGILSLRAQEYFRHTREASLGHPLEDLLDSDKEEQLWNAMDEDMRAVGGLMRTHKDKGPFVLGDSPSFTDFFIAGSLQNARMIDERVFQRIIDIPGYGEVYDACLPFMAKKD